MVGHTLSISDLLLIDNFKQAFGSEDKQAIETILFENGMDVKEPYSLEFSKHRNLRGNIVSCQRYVGEERQDRKWVKGGAASWECLVESCDLDLRIALKTMSQQSNNTGKICAELERHAGN